jgi:Arc/MetJ-type ribon-helix-helix transcriptional regulator
MTIHVTRPEVEAIINERLQSGAFEDAEDVILQALRASAQEPHTRETGKSLVDVCAIVRGLTDDVDFSRNPSTGRLMDIA